MNRGKTVNINGYKIKFCESVYAPESDTYLFIDKINFVNKKDRLLDMGTGTGIHAIYFSKFFRKVYAVDINPYAIYCAMNNAKLNEIQNIIFVLENLFNSFPNTFTFDTILFNPPYLPTEDYARTTKKTRNYLNSAWSGGPTGNETISIFLKHARQHLSNNGNIFFLISSLTNPDRVFKILEEERYQYVIIHKEKLFFEELTLINAW